MSSWIKCDCGSHLHINLFSGAGLKVMVDENIIDRLDETVTVAEAISKIVIGSDIAVKCKDCNSLWIKYRSGEAICYKPI